MNTHALLYFAKGFTYVAAPAVSVLAALSIGAAWRYFGSLEHKADQILGHRVTYYWPRWTLAALLLWVIVIALYGV